MRMRESTMCSIVDSIFAWHFSRTFKYVIVDSNDTLWYAQCVRLRLKFKTTMFNQKQVLKIWNQIKSVYGF